MSLFVPAYFSLCSNTNNGSFYPARAIARSEERDKKTAEKTLEYRSLQQFWTNLNNETKETVLNIPKQRIVDDLVEGAMENVAFMRSCSCPGYGMDYNDSTSSSQNNNNNNNTGDENNDNVKSDTKIITNNKNSSEEGSNNNNNNSASAAVAVVSTNNSNSNGSGSGSSGSNSNNINLEDKKLLVGENNDSIRTRCYTTPESRTELPLPQPRAGPWRQCNDDYSTISSTRHVDVYSNPFAGIASSQHFDETMKKFVTDSPALNRDACHISDRYLAELMFRAPGSISKLDSHYVLKRLGFHTGVPPLRPEPFHFSESDSDDGEFDCENGRDTYDDNETDNIGEEEYMKAMEHWNGEEGAEIFSEILDVNNNNNANENEKSNSSSSTTNNDNNNKTLKSTLELKFRKRLNKLLSKTSNAYDVPNIYRPDSLDLSDSSGNYKNYKMATRLPQRMKYTEENGGVPRAILLSDSFFEDEQGLKRLYDVTHMTGYKVSAKRNLTALTPGFVSRTAATATSSSSSSSSFSQTTTTTTKQHNHHFYVKHPLHCPQLPFSISALNEQREAKIKFVQKHGGLVDGALHLRDMDYHPDYNISDFEFVTPFIHPQDMKDFTRERRKENAVERKKMYDEGANNLTNEFYEKYPNIDNDENEKEGKKKKDEKEEDIIQKNMDEVQHSEKYSTSANCMDEQMLVDEYESECWYEPYADSDEDLQVEQEIREKHEDDKKYVIARTEFYKKNPQISEDEKQEWCSKYKAAREEFKGRPKWQDYLGDKFFRTVRWKNNLKEGSRLHGKLNNPVDEKLREFSDCLRRFVSAAMDCWDVDSLINDTMKFLKLALMTSQETIRFEQLLGKHLYSHVVGGEVATDVTDEILKRVIHDPSLASAFQQPQQQQQQQDQSSSSSKNSSSSASSSSSKNKNKTGGTNKNSSSSSSQQQQSENNNNTNNPEVNFQNFIPETKKATIFRNAASSPLFRFAGRTRIGCVVDSHTGEHEGNTWILYEEKDPAVSSSKKSNSSNNNEHFYKNNSNFEQEEEERVPEWKRDTTIVVMNGMSELETWCFVHFVYSILRVAWKRILFARGIARQNQKKRGFGGYPFSTAADEMNTNDNSNDNNNKKNENSSSSSASQKQKQKNKYIPPIKNSSALQLEYNNDSTLQLSAVDQVMICQQLSQQNRGGFVVSPLSSNTCNPALSCTNTSFDVLVCRARANLNDGDKFMRLRMFGEASTCFTTAIDICPSAEFPLLSHALVGRASAYQEAGSYVLAIQDCTAALFHDPDRVEASFVRATSLASLAETQWAENHKMQRSFFLCALLNLAFVSYPGDGKFAHDANALAHRLLKSFKDSGFYFPCPPWEMKKEFPVLVPSDCCLLPPHIQRALLERLPVNCFDRYQPTCASKHTYHLDKLKDEISEHPAGFCGTQNSEHKSNSCDFCLNLYAKRKAKNWTPRQVYFTSGKHSADTKANKNYHWRYFLDCCIPGKLKTAGKGTFVSASNNNLNVTQQLPNTAASSTPSNLQEMSLIITHMAIDHCVYDYPQQKYYERPNCWTEEKKTSSGGMDPIVPAPPPTTTARTGMIISSPQRAERALDEALSCLQIPTTSSQYLEIKNREKQQQIQVLQQAVQQGLSNINSINSSSSSGGGGGSSGNSNLTYTKQQQQQLYQFLSQFVENFTKSTLVGSSQQQQQQQQQNMLSSSQHLQLLLPTSSLAGSRLSKLPQQQQNNQQNNNSNRLTVEPNSLTSVPVLMDDKTRYEFLMLQRILSQTTTTSNKDNNSSNNRDGIIVDLEFLLSNFPKNYKTFSCSSETKTNDDNETSQQQVQQQQQFAIEERICQWIEGSEKFHSPRKYIEAARKSVSDCSSSSSQKISLTRSYFDDEQFLVEVQREMILEKEIESRNKKMMKVENVTSSTSTTVSASAAAASSSITQEATTTTSSKKEKEAAKKKEQQQEKETSSATTTSKQQQQQEKQPEKQKQQKEMSPEALARLRNKQQQELQQKEKDEKRERQSIETQMKKEIDSLVSMKSARERQMKERTKQFLKKFESLEISENSARENLISAETKEGVKNYFAVEFEKEKEKVIAREKAAKEEKEKRQQQQPPKLSRKEKEAAKKKEEQEKKQQQQQKQQQEKEAEKPKTTKQEKLKKEQQQQPEKEKEEGKEKKTRKEREQEKLEKQRLAKKEQQQEKEKEEKERKEREKQQQQQQEEKQEKSSSRKEKLGLMVAKPRSSRQQQQQQDEVSQSKNISSGVLQGLLPSSNTATTTTSTSIISSSESTKGLSTYAKAFIPSFLHQQTSSPPTSNTIILPQPSNTTTTTRVESADVLSTNTDDLFGAGALLHVPIITNNNNAFDNNATTTTSSTSTGNNNIRNVVTTQEATRFLPGDLLGDVESSNNNINIAAASSGSTTTSAAAIGGFAVTSQPTTTSVSQPQLNTTTTQQQQPQAGGTTTTMSAAARFHLERRQQRAAAQAQTQQQSLSPQTATAIVAPQAATAIVAPASSSSGNTTTTTTSSASATTDVAFLLQSISGNTTNTNDQKVDDDLVTRAAWESSQNQNNNSNDNSNSNKNNSNDDSNATGNSLLFGGGSGSIF